MMPPSPWEKGGEKDRALNLAPFSPVCFVFQNKWGRRAGVKGESRALTGQAPEAAAAGRIRQFAQSDARGNHHVTIW